MTFKQSTTDRINGWGQVFRFITPILISMGLWIMSDVKTEIRDIKIAAKEVTAATVIYNTNHLKHHEEFEARFCERLAAIETFLKFRLK